jgi:hypothetical protein
MGGINGIFDICTIGGGVGGRSGLFPGMFGVD